MKREALNYGNVVPNLLQEVPELRPAYAEHMRDNRGELLSHVFFGDVTRFVLEEVRAGRTGTPHPVARILDFMERALASCDEKVKDLVLSSFVQNLYEPKDMAFAKIRTMLGPNLAKGLHDWETWEPPLPPLHWAAAWDRKEVVVRLIAEGADINARDNFGMTALQWAMQQKRDDVEDVLRKAGAKEQRGTR